MTYKAWDIVGVIKKNPISSPTVGETERQSWLYVYLDCKNCLNNDLCVLKCIAFIL